MPVRKPKHPNRAGLCSASRVQRLFNLRLLLGGWLLYTPKWGQGSHTNFDGNWDALNIEMAIKTKSVDEVTIVNILTNHSNNREGQRGTCFSTQVSLVRPPGGAVFINQYYNPPSKISLRDIQAQIGSIMELVCKTLWGINSCHASLAFKAGESSMVMQVLIRRTGIPISMSLLYMTIARQLGVPLEPVNFPNHFLLRWCQGAEGANLDIFDYIYIDACGKGRQLMVKECEYLISQHVTAALYGVVNVKKVLQRLVGNLLSLGKREDIDQSYQLLRDSLDLYLAMSLDQVQLFLLQARLYFYLGTWPEKSFCLILEVLDIFQHIHTLNPGQHGVVGYLVQHTRAH
ncbi:hypothetical protein QTO34_005665 [Cnephaeus nilssonii]|uniref:Protein SirB1 N-terminal domain-containing protein n=1 Tax=Cnephaeus nilssonii TaxID=3371016 RepID=A0AA40HNV0_CNENI|nr:hypothetical protein QTO34_005665 [Eptesicus nilssonii]